LDVTEGKTVYTKDGATIRYRSSDDGAEWKTIILKQGENIEWIKSGEMEVVTGDILLYRDSPEKKTVNLAELKYLPIVSGTYIELNPGNSSLEILYGQ